MNKKIHIIGSIGSGKTTLATKMSLEYGIPFYELDNVVWKRLISGDVKRSKSERDKNLTEIINLDNWIIEGVHHKWVGKSFEVADEIIFLDIKLPVRRFRIIKRYIMQKISYEPANYTPTLKILMDLYKYNTFFEYISKPEILKILEPYEHKLIIVKNEKQIQKHLEEVKHNRCSN